LNNPALGCVTSTVSIESISNFLPEPTATSLVWPRRVAPVALDEVWDEAVGLGSAAQAASAMAELDATAVPSTALLLMLIVMGDRARLPA